MEANQVIIEKTSPFDFQRTVDLITENALKREWQIPFIHDLQQSMAKSGKSVKPVKVIEMCKPRYSGQMLEKNDERIVSVMMPCRISVYMKDDGRTYVSMINIAELSSSMPENIKELMSEASEELDDLIQTFVAGK
jgi:uncharacterized protein (DUF302 family)